MSEEVGVVGGAVDSESGSAKPGPGPDEELMPTARKERNFECSNCGGTVSAKSLEAVCTGVDIGVAVEMPDGEWVVFKNGLNTNGDPVLLPGRVVKISREDGEVYSHDGKLVLDVGWVENAGGQVPGEHSPIQMKEVRS